MGLITLALGAATLSRIPEAGVDRRRRSDAAHMIAHAAFKHFAFMAPTVLAATGLRDHLLGGLAR